MVGFDWHGSGHQFLKIDGVALEARAWGPPPSAACTIILLHEGLGSVAMWRDFPQALADRTDCGVLAYSRQGYGASDACALPRPLDYMEREARDVLGPVLDASGVRQAVLFGHSDGGSIAALYAGFKPDPRVRGIVLMAPHFFVEDVSIHAIERARAAWRETDLPVRLGKYHTRPEIAFRGWNNAWLNPGFRAWDIRDALAELRVPCLAIQGHQDPYGTAAQVKIIEERSPSPVAIHLLDDCEHSPHREQSERTLALIADFVRSLDPASGAEVAP
ncbi:MAG: alpha/beta hydrolase [Pseudomonadota bacterium]